MKSVSSHLEHFFLAASRRTAPGLFAASLLAGCATSQQIQTDQTYCLDTEITSKTLLSQQFSVQTRNVGRNDHCLAAMRAVDLGLARDEQGLYRHDALRVLRFYIENPSLDLATRTQVELRLKAQDLKVSDIARLERDAVKAEAVKLGVPICETGKDNIRRCLVRPAP